MGGISFQQYEENLARGLLEILQSREQDLLVGIGREYFYGIIENAQTLYHKEVKEWLEQFITNNLNFYANFLISGKEYASAGISQVYPTYRVYDFERHFNLWQKIFKHNNVVVVCGDKIFDKVTYNILDISKSIQYVYGPTKHAYNEIQWLKLHLQRLPKDKLLVFALGPAGKVLAYQMFQMGFRVLDIGHTIKDYDWYRKGIVMDWDKIAEFFGPDT